MARERDWLMVTVSGRDRPGITATLMRVLAAYGVDVIDIQQASIQNILGLYFILDLSTSKDPKDSVIKDLLYEASRLKLRLDFQFFSESDFRGIRNRNLFVLTLFGGTDALAGLSKVLAEENANIEMIATYNHHGARSIEMMIDVNGVASLDRLKNRVMIKSRELQADLALQKMDAYRKNKRLIFFDMDSTLVDMEVIDEMARRAGVHGEVARITEKTMRGDFDFEEALTQRVALLKGLTEDALRAIREGIPLSEGVEELTRTLKWLGYKMGIVTGGFDFFADHIRDTLGFDFAFANRLEIKGGKMTGRLVGEVIDAAGKARIVYRQACDLGIPLDQTVVVGDGANDALMLGQAGLGIAYNAKRRLDRVASASLGKARMANILHLLGITEEDIREAATCKPSP